MKSAPRAVPTVFLPAVVLAAIALAQPVPLAAAPAGRSGEEIERSPGDGRIRALRGELSPPSPEGPRGIAERFLSTQAARFGMAPGLADLRLARVVESPAGRHFRFEQVFRGLPVFDAGADVHVAADGRVFLASNEYAPGIDLPVSPSRAPAAVAALATGDFLKNWSAAVDKKGGTRPYRGEALKLAKEIVPELGIYAGPPRLAYRMVVSAESPFGVVEYVVDAHTGAILRRRSLVQDSHLTGRGQVFDPSPVNTLGDMGLRDLDNADDPAFAPAYRTVPLPGVSRWLFDLFGAPILSGPYVKINDLIEAPSYNQPFSMTGDFLYTRDRQEFEDVMAYFHIDRTQRYIQSLGFATVNNRMIRVDPHGLNGADNSHYVGFPFGMGWIAFGEGGVDDAEDADVVLHEYGHAMQDNQTMGKYLGFGEAGAQGEGFGDYWAFSNGPTGPGAFDPACLAEWDFAGICLRRLDSTRHYPEDLAFEVHDDGEIWSSTLHDLFLSLGKETTDRVVLQSHFLVPFLPRFCDGARALRDADNALYGGAHGEAIGTTVAAHGIASDLAAAGLAVTSAGPSTADLHLEIVNRGPCAAGGATHSIRLVCEASGDLGEVGSVETAGLPRGGSAAFDLTLPAREESCVYRVVVDAGGAEPEASEGNNTADSPAFGG